MSDLLIRRKHAIWQDRLRSYRVCIDGLTVGLVENGGELRIPVAPGRHTVQLKIDWCSSPLLEVQVAAGQVLALDGGPNVNPLLVLLYVTLWKGRYLWLREDAAVLRRAG